MFLENSTYHWHKPRELRLCYKPLFHCSVVMRCCSTGCFSKDQVYLDGILRILRHRRNIDFKMLTSLGKVNSIYLNSVNRLYTTYKSLTLKNNLACRCPMKMWKGFVILRSCGEPGSLISCKTKNVTCSSWTTSSWLMNWTMLNYKSSFHEDKGLVIREFFSASRFDYLVISSCDSVKKKKRFLF